MPFWPDHKEGTRHAWVTACAFRSAARRMLAQCRRLQPNPPGIARSLTERLAQECVYVSRRLGRLRISPHVYNDETDVDRFIEVFRRAVT
jgi:selenocysteine lyase/cysteine desulfurase